MELTHISLKALRALKPAINATHNAPGHAQAVKILGIYAPVLLNRTTQHILNPWLVDGLEAHQESAEIPVLVVDCPAENETLLSHVLNGGIDGRLLSLPEAESTIDWLMTLVEKAKYISIEALGVDLDYLQLIFDIYAYGSPQEAEPVQPPVTDWNIPELDINRQLTADIIQAHPFSKWGSRPRNIKHYAESVTHFYVDDPKFNALVSHPKQFIDCQPAGAVEVNFSTYPESPAALVIADIYRKRWLGRTWQQAGIPIAVDLNVCREYLEMNLLGVPQGWTSYANRSYQDDLDHLQEAYEIACNHAGTKNITYLVYGGTTIKQHCIENKWLWKDSTALWADEDASATTTPL